MIAPNTNYHLLIVDDDHEIRSLLTRFFVKHGFRVTAVADGTSMRKALNDRSIEMIILDVMLPGEDGLHLCRELRQNSNIPVILLTVLGDETDRIVGLEMGADDYLAKPFNPRELLARIKAVLRRHNAMPISKNERNIVLQFDNWRLDIGSRKLFSPAGALIDMSTGEFDLLAALAEHPHQTLTREQLLDITKHRSENPFERSIDMQISRLRKKIEKDPNNPDYIKTVRGRGYVFASNVSSS